MVVSRWLWLYDVEVWCVFGGQCAGMTSDGHVVWRHILTGVWHGESDDLEGRVRGCEVRLCMHVVL